MLLTEAVPIVPAGAWAAFAARVRYFQLYGAADQPPPLWGVFDIQGTAIPHLHRLFYESLGSRVDNDEWAREFVSNWFDLRPSPAAASYPAVTDKLGWARLALRPVPPHGGAFHEVGRRIVISTREQPTLTFQGGVLDEHGHLNGLYFTEPLAYESVLTALGAVILT